MSSSRSPFFRARILSTITLLAFAGSSQALAFGPAPSRFAPQPTAAELPPPVSPHPDGLFWLGPRMHQTIEHFSKAPITWGNEVRLLVNGPEFFPVRLQMIKNAKRTLDVQNYLWRDDEAGLAVANALADAERRGVRVRIILDYLNVFPHAESYRIVQRAGAELIQVNSPSWGRSLNLRLHEKVFVVDGREALIGGANFADEYMIDRPTAPVWHDLELRVRGPVIESMQRRFDANWNWMANQEIHARLASERPETTPNPRIYGEPTPVEADPVGTAFAVYQHQQPYGSVVPADGFVTMFSSIVRSVDRRLVLYVAYLLPNPEFERAILEVARRGNVEILLLTNSARTNDMAGTLSASAMTHYGRLMHAGVRIFEIQDRTLHAKAILVDRKALSVGSHNFTYRSFSTNGEANLMTDDPVAIDRFEEMVRSDLAAFHEVTREELRSRMDGVGEGIRAIIGRWVGRLF